MEKARDFLAEMQKPLKKVNEIKIPRKNISVWEKQLEEETDLVSKRWLEVNIEKAK